jgi:hypothetical protein
VGDRASKVLNTAVLKVALRPSKMPRCEGPGSLTGAVGRLRNPFRSPSYSTSGRPLCRKMRKISVDGFGKVVGTAMKEQSDESRYVRLNRLRMAIEEKALLRSRQDVTDESVRNKTERLRQLRLAKEAIDRATRKQRST